MLFQKIDNAKKAQEEDNAFPVFDVEVGADVFEENVGGVKKHVTCSHCKKLGHNIRGCPSKVILYFILLICVGTFISINGIHYISMVGVES